MLSRWKWYWCSQNTNWWWCYHNIKLFSSAPYTYTIALNLLCFLFLYQFFASFWITLSKVIALPSIPIVAFLLLEAIVIRKRFLFIFVIALKRVKDGQLSLTKKWKSDNCIGSNKARKEFMNQCAKTIQKKEVKSDNFWYRKVGREKFKREQ